MVMSKHEAKKSAEKSGPIRTYVEIAAKQSTMPLIIVRVTFPKPEIMKQKCKKVWTGASTLGIFGFETVFDERKQILEMQQRGAGPAKDHSWHLPAGCLLRCVQTTTKKNSNIGGVNV